MRGTIYSDDEDESQAEESNADEEEEGQRAEMEVAMTDGPQEYNPNSYFKNEPMVHGFKDFSPVPSEYDDVSVLISKQCTYNH